MLFSRKDLTKLLIPLLIEQMLAVAVGMADVVMVAAVGEAAVSGVAGDRRSGGNLPVSWK